MCDGGIRGLKLADACSRVWGDRAKMEAVLNEAFPSVPYCKFLYALDTNAVQITSNISPLGGCGAFRAVALHERGTAGHG